MAHPMTPFEPTGIRLGIARGITFGLFGPTEEIVEPIGDLGAGLLRVSVYWSQFEPEPGRFDWAVIDSLLEQITVGIEVWVTVCASSPWATRQSTDFLPPSPANDEAAYSRFVRALVARCARRVQYWQCNNEPSNIPLLWSGSASEYVTQLRLFHRAVRAADPSAAVVLGGCGYDMLSSPADGPARQFFDHVVGAGADSFDLFAIHLYDDPALIPTHVETVREMMRSHGYERPVIVGEYNGPTLFEFPELEPVLQQTMSAAFVGDESAGMSTGELAASVNVETPERRAMRALYAAMPQLPAQLRMFMHGCGAELDARRDRINCREIVARNLFALSTGVRRTACWLLAPEVPNFEDPLTMMELMHGKLPLLAYDGTELARRRPSAETFWLLADHLERAVSVTRIEPVDRHGLIAFRIERGAGGPVDVMWKEGDVFTGEDEPPISIEWNWPHDTVAAIDALGEPVAVDHRDGSVRLAVSVTPVLLSSPGEWRSA